MRRKEYLLVIDTETCNSMEQPLVYDIGYAITDRQGNIILERSFVVADIFLDCSDVMQSAYYAKKIPAYWDDLKEGKRTLKTLYNIQKQIKEDMKKYKVKKVGAYNMAFDKRALNTTIRYCTKSRLRWFFPYGTEFFCIWHMACQVVMTKVKYLKFALQNGLISGAGNVQTSAEACYRYLIDNVEFIESHTGLEDVKIEVAIMAQCYKEHKQMNKAINSHCWRIPQKKLKKIIKKG